MTRAYLRGFDLQPSVQDRLNNLGQIVFAYELENGVSGIAVATPVPEPRAAAAAMCAAMLIMRRRERERGH